MKYSDLKDRMSCYIRTYLYICPVIAGDVVESSRSGVNLKQCSTQKLNYAKEYGLTYVSMFVILEKKNIASCRDNVDATKINMSLNVFSAFAEYFWISNSTHLSLSCWMNSIPASSTPLCRPTIFVGLPRILRSLSTSAIPSQQCSDFPGISQRGDQKRGTYSVPAVAQQVTCEKTI